MLGGRESEIGIQNGIHATSSFPKYRNAVFGYWYGIFAAISVGAGVDEYTTSTVTYVKVGKPSGGIISTFMPSPPHGPPWNMNGSPDVAYGVPLMMEVRALCYRKQSE